MTHTPTHSGHGHLHDSNERHAHAGCGNTYTETSKVAGGRIERRDSAFEELLEDHSKKEMRADGRTGLATMAWNGMTDHTSEAEQAQKQAQRRAQKLKEWVNKKIANGERVTAEEKKQFLEKLDEDEEKKRENKWNEFSRKSREKRERIEREMEARKAQEASKRMQVARR